VAVAEVVEVVCNILNSSINYFFLMKLLNENIKIKYIFII